MLNLGIMKEKKQRRKYDAEFKAEVLKMMSNGQSARDISQKLDIGENLIYRWKAHQKVALEDKTGEADPGMLSLLEENERLRAQVKRAELERDILKKAVSIFSQLKE